MTPDTEDLVDPHGRGGEDLLPVYRKALRSIAAYDLETEKHSWMGRAFCANGPADLWDEDPRRPAEPLEDGPKYLNPRNPHWRDLPDPALLMCGWCPVWAECLAWAETTGDEWSIAGGMTPDQRRTARRLASVASDAA